MMKISVMKKGDLAAAKEVVKDAFWCAGKSETFNEWELADKIMSDEGYVDELCLIASEDDKVVGYNLLSKVTIGSHVGLGLGPIAVKKAYQKNGIGKALMREALKKAEEMGFDYIVLLGGEYYRQFGFMDACDFGVILSENHPENKYIKILYLRDGMKDKVNGTLRYCASFYDENGALL